jgi:DEP domain-containing protein 5
MSRRVSPPRLRRRASSATSDDTVRGASDDPQLQGKPAHDSSASKPELASLWVHDESFSKDEVLVNPDTFHHVRIAAGDLVQIVALRTSLEVRDFEKSSVVPLTDSEHPLDRKDTSNDEDKTSPAIAFGRRGSFDIDDSMKYYFIAKPFPADLKVKHPSLQVSLVGSIATLFGLRKGVQVVVSKVERRDCAASHVELIVRDEYLARSDMWRLVSSELAGKTVYKGQKILFLGTIKALIKCIWIRGQKVSAAYFSEDTVPVFRSESARYVLFIQMSKEMWDFDSEGSGEILFNRVVNGFLPDLFKRWVELEVKHLVSIVMFGRLEYSQSSSTSLVGLREGLQQSASAFAAEQTSEKDFYRVVVTDMASGQWTTILNELKKEFRIFLRDISLQAAPPDVLAEDAQDENTTKPQARISGRPSTALRGNILEAINIASSQFANDYIDRDLVRTGISTVVVTPGSGVFEVDRDLLNLTSANLTNNGIGIGLVCLSKMPLHSVPLFKYRRQGLSGGTALLEVKPGHLPVSHSVVGSWSSRTYGVSPSTMSGSFTRSPSRFTFLKPPRNIDDFSYGIPQWIDLSYWSAEVGIKRARKYKIGGAKEYVDVRYTKPFEPRLRMYELQMMGVMEIGLANISIPYLSEDSWKTPHDVLGRHDPNEGKLPAPPNRSDDDVMIHKKRAATIETHHKGLLSLQAKQQGDLYDRMDAYDSMLFNAHHRALKKGKPPLSQKLHGDARGNSDNRDMSNNGAETAPHIAGAGNSSRSSVIQKPDKDSGQVRSTLMTLNPKQKLGPSTSASRLSRSISFALRGLAPPPRAAASTEIHVQNVQAEPSTKGVEPARTFTNVSSGLKSPSLVGSDFKTRPSLESQSSDLSESGQSRGESIPSRPIEIGTPKLKAQDQTRTTTGPMETVRSATLASNSSRDAYSGTTARLPGVEEGDKLSHNSEAIKDIAAIRDATELSPWIRRVNPSNPAKNHLSATLGVGRWQHLHPRPPKASGMKWSSLCTPAAVPLTTEEFPTKMELDTLFEQKSYTVSQDTSRDLSEVPKSRESLVHEMLALRFTHGYQLVVGPRLVDACATQTPTRLVFMDLGKVVNDGNCIFMSMGNSIQKISFTNSTEVHITKFIRKPPEKELKSSQSITYHPSIRTIVSSSYTTKTMRHAGFSEEYPWKLADQYLAGRVEHGNNVVKQLRFWRARFVLIPVEPPASAHRPVQTMSEDNEEEIHLLGIRALTQLWQRYRYIPPEGPKFKPTTGRRKDPNPLEINFQTLNPSEVVATELDKFSAAEDAGEGLSTQLLPESEMLERETCNLSQLAQIMQSEKGIDILTRRWHLQLHFHCFKGDDFTDWLTLNFKDIGTREEAVEFGNELMQHGLFQHTSKRHNFKDGNYFYQIDAEYRTPRPESKNSWFPSSRRSDRSVPSTPAAEIPPKDSPLGSRARSASNSIEEGQDVPGSAPPRSASEKKRMSIALSKVMRLDVDHRKRSNRPEIIDLHYDRLHNPENCYHLELSWLNVTSKLVEDAIVTWAIQGEKYGLKLVEVPIAEVSNVSDHEPFRAPSRLKLSVPPPKASIAAANGNTYFTSTSFTPQAPQKLDPLLYQKALLKRFNFVLDLEAASDFPPDVDVEYSWGKLEYRYSQFVHRSGVILAQITDEGDFLLLANRLYNTRSASSKDSTGKFDAKKDHYGGRASTLPPPTSASGIIGLNLQQPSPQASPMVYASSDVLGSKAALAASGMVTYITPEQIFWELEDFCNDKAKLEAFYKEVAAAPPSIPRRRSSSTSSSSALRPVRDLEMSIPELVLPASLAPTIMSPWSTGSGVRKGRKASPNVSEVGRESPRRKATD